MNTSLQIIKKFKLEAYLKALITENQGNNNPYHNYYHITTVLKNCYFIGKSEKLKDSDIKNILIGALFHDFNHSGGKIKDDNKNIEIAIKAFKKHSKETKQNNEIIESIIKCTRFPYDKNETLNINQKVIRDADLLQSLEDNYIQQCLFGLSSESGSGKVEKSNLEGQIKFLSNIEMFTDYTKEKYKNKLPSIIEDCEYIIDIIN